MRNPNTLHMLILGAVLAVSTHADAASRKAIESEFDASDLTELRLRMNVGELTVEVWDLDTINVEIELEADRHWLTWRRRDVDEIELGVRHTGESLLLEIDENNLNQEWLVRIPAHLALEIETGVGELAIEGFRNSLLVDLGLGSISVEVDDIDYDKIHLSTGVGDSTIRGFGRTTDERAMVSADASYVGRGEHSIEIDVGVGEALVRKR